jgi:dTDP-4-dehydrorhamnose reductase
MAETTLHQRWLITGANGFLGANLGYFLNGKVDRIGSMRSSAKSIKHFDQVVEIDLFDHSKIHEQVDKVAPAVIVHTAAISSHELCEADPMLAIQINVESTKALALAAKNSGAQFIFISTDAVFNGDRGKYNEEDQPDPTSVYGHTKLAAERAVLEIDPSALIIRTNFFGWSPTGTRSILEFFVNSLSAGKNVNGFTDFTVTSCYAQTLAQAIEDLVDIHASGILHVASSNALSKYEFGIEIARQFGLDESLITPSASNMKPARGRNQSLDVRLAKSMLDGLLPTQEEEIKKAQVDLILRSDMTFSPIGPAGNQVS